MKVSLADYIWLAWYGFLALVAAVITWVSTFAYVHHLFIVAGPKFVIWIWVFAWPLLIAFAVAKALKRTLICVSRSHDQVH